MTFLLKGFSLSSSFSSLCSALDAQKRERNLFFNSIMLGSELLRTILSKKLFLTPPVTMAIETPQKIETEKPPTSLAIGKRRRAG